MFKKKYFGDHCVNFVFINRRHANFHVYFYFGDHCDHFVFINRRHANFRDILKGLNVGPKNLESYDVTHKFHHVFFFGDLNYRVEDSIQVSVLFS